MSVDNSNDVPDGEIKKISRSSALGCSISISTESNVLPGPIIADSAIVIIGEGDKVPGFGILAATILEPVTGPKVVVSSASQTITGGSISFTVTLNVQAGELTLPAVSVISSVTVVVPTGKTEPLGKPVTAIGDT